MKRKALGRGLDSLIPAFMETGPVAEGMRMIDIDLIRPGEHQPREQFDTDELKELSDSIKEHGIIQPVILKKDGERYQIIAGERRWRAAQLAGLLKIPCIIREMGENKALEVSLVENIQRKELNPIEEAKAYQVLIKDFGLSQEEIARRVGRKRSSITNSLRLLRLPARIQGFIKRGDLSMGHAKAVAGLESEQAQIQLALRIVERSLSVRQAENLAARLKSPRTKKGAAHTDPNLLAAEKVLQRSLGTKVRIIKRGRRGRIEILFYSNDELDRLYRILTQESQK